MRSSMRLLFAAICLSPLASAGAADFDAEGYHADNCTRCHDAGVYTRENRRVQSYGALQAQVARCDSMLETQLFPDDMAALVDYLNERYYGFTK